MLHKKVSPELPEISCGVTHQCSTFCHIPKVSEIVVVQWFVDRGLPIDAGDVNDHINHVTAQFICLHVHWTAVCCNVNLTDHIEQEGLLNTRVLKAEAETEKCKTLIVPQLHTNNVL